MSPPLLVFFTNNLRKWISEIHESPGIGNDVCPVLNVRALVGEEHQQGHREQDFNSRSNPGVTFLDQFFDSYRTNPGEATEISDEIKAEILRNIHRKGHQERSNHFWPLLRIAAAISLLLVLSYFIINHAGSEAETKPAVVAKIEEVSTSKGQKLDIELIDGTRIRLNANSKITYPETFTESIREVTLEGEAYFDVARDATRPFIVRTQFANTQVLGTSFNIHTSAEAVAVTLVEGKVNVSVPNGPSALLSPNQQASVLVVAK